MVGRADTVVRALLEVCGTVLVPAFCEIGRTDPLRRQTVAEPLGLWSISSSILQPRAVRLRVIRPDILR